MFDPFKATYQEAFAHQPDPSAVGNSTASWVSAQFIIHNRARFEKRPLDAIAHCVRNGLAAPAWLADAFLQKYDAFETHEVATLDKAFATAEQHGKRLSTLRLQRKYGLNAHALFNGPHKLPRTLKGRTKAAGILGISEKQVRTLLGTTRSNGRGHVVYGYQKKPVITAHDPFSIARGKVPKY